MNIQQLQNKVNQLEKIGYEFHHSAYHKGYCRKDGGTCEEYNGRFGIGYKVALPNVSLRKGIYSRYFASYNKVVLYFIK